MRRARDARTLTALPSCARPQIMREYFGSLEEESIRDNFVLVYELLDEVGVQHCPLGAQGQQRAAWTSVASAP